MESKHQVTLGIDLGGTSIRVGLFNSAMELVGSRRFPTRVAAGPQACVDEMGEAVRSLLGEHGVAMERVLGVGIGSPGPIDLNNGVLGVLPNLPGWDRFPLRDAVSEATGLPVILESDANAAAIAEWKLGAGQEAGLDSMAMITLGTGVGSGLILGGRVWHGMFGMGGEVGHATVKPDGLVCGCGTRGCLEMYASANGLMRLAREVAESGEGTAGLRAVVARTVGFTPADVAELAQAGDAGAKVAFERLGWYLGIGIANLINTLDLPMIVVGGGVASAWALFAPAMFKSVWEYSTVYRLVAPTQQDRLETNRTYVRAALLGPDAGLLGAALLPRLACEQEGSPEREQGSRNAALTPEMAR